jgi:hypothetical protein
MKSKDFAALFPEIDKPQSLFASLKKHCASKGFPEEDFFSKLHDFSPKRKNYTGYKDAPEKYLREVISNAIIDYSKKLGKERENIEKYKARLKTEVEQPQEFDDRSIENKIRAFLAEMRRRNYSDKEILIVELMGEAITKAKGNKNKDFREALYLEAERLNITQSNVRKILERLRISSKDNGDLKGFFHFISKADTDFANLLEVLLENDPVNNAELAAYRFSSEEMDKMLWLKRLFEGNQYTFNPDRFPEVYYDDYDKVKEVFPWIETGHEGTPDYLGVYIYQLNDNACRNKPCQISKEGVIVLFRDRIERYRGTDIDSTRFVVLMHEFGHWLTHWAYRNGFNWKIAYYLGKKNTHEALAQLIAYWACNNTIHLNTLIQLTPKKRIEADDLPVDDSLLFSEDLMYNIKNPYGKYRLLIDKTEESILKKIVQLREAWMLKDEIMIEFLLSEEDDTEPWLNSLNAANKNALCENEISFENCALGVSSRLLNLFEVKIPLGSKFGRGIFSNSSNWYEYECNK